MSSEPIHEDPTDAQRTQARPPMMRGGDTQTYSDCVEQADVTVFMLGQDQDALALTGRNARLEAKLLKALPPASRVLECGCGDGWLGKRYKALQPQAVWHGIDNDPQALARAKHHLDAVFERDLDHSRLDDVGGDYDLLVIGCVLEYLRDPCRLLRLLRALCTPQGRLVCAVPNMCHMQVIEQMLAADLQYDASGLLDADQLHLLSSRSMMKLLLDTGWIPNTADFIVRPSHSQALAVALADAARAIGIPIQTASENMTVSHLVIDCLPSPWLGRLDCAEADGTAAARPPKRKVSVIVPVNNEGQLCRNLLKSPGLRELDTELILCRNAASAAQAFEWGRARAHSDWLIYCHQDVYFPVGFGQALASELDGVAQHDAPGELIGLIGLAMNERDEIFETGFVVNRLNALDYPASKRAISIDELGIVVSRDTVHRLDPAFGWHLWCTDLCLQAERRNPARPARSVRLPVYHNSNYDGDLPPAFHASEKVLLEKYPDLDIVPSLTKCVVRL